MSKDLPLWEDDESDVKLEYRLQYGHVLIATQDLYRVLTKIYTVFKLGKPLSTLNDIQQERLPRKGDVVLLANDVDWHFILAKFRRNIAVFGPHRLFLGSYGWTTVSRKLRVQLACILADIDVLYYTVFRNGKHLGNVNLDSKGFQEALIGPIDVFFNAKPIYKYRDKESKFTEEIKKFISMDFVVHVDEKRRLRFKRPLSENELVEPDEICHAVFKAKIQEDNSYPHDTRNVRNPIDILIQKVGGLFIK